MVAMLILVTLSLAVKAAMAALSDRLPLLLPVAMVAMAALAEMAAMAETEATAVMVVQAEPEAREEMPFRVLAVAEQVAPE
ncbi:hypothetical protein KQ944_10635 [Bacillus subtilis]|nr:hypothetical protein [Bacillus subtilis]